MTKKLTITVSDEVYKGLHKRVGGRKISRFIDELARERLADRSSPEYWLSASDRELAAAYAEQAAYETAQPEQTRREHDARLNGLIGDALRTDRTDADIAEKGLRSIVFAAHLNPHSEGIKPMHRITFHPPRKTTFSAAC